MEESINRPNNQESHYENHIMKRKTLKRILSVIFAFTLLLALLACGKTIGTGGDKPAGSVIQETVTAPGNASVSNKEKTDEKETTGNKDNKNEPTTASGNTSQQQAGEGTYPVGGNSGGYETPTYDSTPQQPAQTPTEAPTEPPTQPQAQTWTISVTVDGCEYGGIFGGGTFTFYYQPTAFDALTATGLAYTGDSNYVSSINGLAQMEHGQMSGWLYAVNGWEPGVGCGSYYLNDGDFVYWHYHSGDELRNESVYLYA